MSLALACVTAIAIGLNGHLGRKQQNEQMGKNRKHAEEMAERNRKFTAELERNRQNFQLGMYEKQVQDQIEMSRMNHKMRLEEQEKSFELKCQSTEWEHFASEWPLWVRPMVLREEQILDDGSVALRVLFSKNNNPVFSNNIYPEIEQGLVEFVDLYHNRFGSRNLLFYHNSFKENYYGGAFHHNIHYALEELPVLIIDTNVLRNDIRVSATIWGFGKSQWQHDTVFKIPYHWDILDNGKVDPKSISRLTDQILAHLKFIIGYAYDIYNLMVYNQMPLFPKVARCELEEGVEGTPLNYSELKDALGLRYREIYDLVLGDSPETVESYKSTILPQLRLDYAKATADVSTQKDYQQYLYDSMTAWVKLRTTEDRDQFLSGLCDGSYRVRKYMAENDVEYLRELSNFSGQNSETTVIVNNCIKFYKEEQTKELYLKLGRTTISARFFHTVALKADGTVVAVGSNGHGRCNVRKWTDIVTDIVAISAGNDYTVGLRADGTVVYAGHCPFKVYQWTDIVAISAGGYHTVGLKADGTVVADSSQFLTDGQCNVRNWTDIVAISAGGYHTVGLRANGTVVAVGKNKDGQCNVDDWTDIVAISAGSFHTVGLRADGTVVDVGKNKDGQCNVDDWTDIVAISAGGSHTVGLRADGTVVAVGKNEDGQCNVSNWTDIVAISAGGCHTVGLRADGTMVAVGKNEDGQCNVNGWSGIRIP